MGCCPETEDINSSEKINPCRLITWLLCGPNSSRQTVWKQSISTYTAWLISILANPYVWLWQAHSTWVLFHCLFQIYTRGLLVSLYSQKLTICSHFMILLVFPPSCPSKTVSISCFLILKVSVLLLSEQHLTARLSFLHPPCSNPCKDKDLNSSWELLVLLETAPSLRVFLLLGKSRVALLLLSLTTAFWYRSHRTKRKQD